MGYEQMKKADIALPLLQADAISFSYAPHTDTSQGKGLIFHDFSLSVEKGEFIAVVGPSGSGKTTLLKLMAGFIQPESGQLRWKGDTIHTPDPSRVVVFQEFDQLFPWKRVWANVEFPLKHGEGTARLADRKIRTERITRILHEVGLYEARMHFPYQLSGGMKQRTALARALVCRPDMLLMDEPFGSLDAQKREELQGLLLRMWREHHFSVIFITHDISEAIFLADRIIVLPPAGGTVKTEIDINLSRPRDRGSSGFREYYQKIYKLL